MSLTKEKIDKLIARLEKELIGSQSDLHAAERLQKLKAVAKEYSGDDQVVSFDDIVARLKDEPEEYKIMSGWPKVDAIIKGFRLQQLVVVSALTKSGKTSWLMDLTTKIAETNPLWLPFEESAEELIRKYLERGIEPPHGFTPNVMMGGEMDWVEAKIVEAIAKYDTKVIFIDQLDFIVPMGGDNHSLRVGEAMRALKGLAKKWNVCIFIICHLVKAKMDVLPTLEDLKGSSSIGQEADTVILLWRDVQKAKADITISNNIIVSVQANRRHGSTGNVCMTFRDGRFIEDDWKQSLEEVAEVDRQFVVF